MNAKVSSNKNRKLKIVLCYFSLVFLVALLILPPFLRIFAKEEEVKETPKIVIVLSCEKGGESISATFLNDDPQNILYKIKGNYTEKKEPVDETTTGDEEEFLGDNNSSTTSSSEKSTETKEEEENILLFEKIKDFSEIEYDEVDDITSLRVNVSSLNKIRDYEITFNTALNQENYYRSLGFVCTKTTL